MCNKYEGEGKRDYFFLKLQGIKCQICLVMFKFNSYIFLATKTLLLLKFQQGEKNLCYCKSEMF